MTPVIEADEQVRSYETLTIAPEGLGYGEGSISVIDRINDPADMLDQEMCDHVAVLTQSNQLVVEVGRDENGKKVEDDGCGDGRAVKQVVCGDKKFNKSLQRQKVFGGGMVMGAASLIANAQVEGSVKDAMTASKDRLKMADLEFGTHTADHHGEKDCGCGACDKAPLILENTLAYQNEISNTVRALANPYANFAEIDAMLDITFERNRRFIEQYPELNQEYKGIEVAETVIKEGKVVNKELTGDHREVRVVINADIEDHTIDQGFIRESTAEVAQIFAVDVPRMRTIAENMFENEHEQKQALVAMLVYSLSTAATLTKGDLPVDIRYAKSPYAFSEAEQYAIAA